MSLRVRSIDAKVGIGIGYYFAFLCMLDQQPPEPYRAKLKLERGLDRKRAGVDPVQKEEGK